MQSSYLIPNHLASIMAASLTLCLQEAFYWLPASLHSTLRRHSIDDSGCLTSVELPRCTVNKLANSGAWPCVQETQTFSIWTQCSVYSAGKFFTSLLGFGDTVLSVTAREGLKAPSPLSHFWQFPQFFLRRYTIIQVHHLPLSLITVLCVSYLPSRPSTSQSTSLRTAHCFQQLWPTGWRVFCFLCLKCSWGVFDGCYGASWSLWACLWQTRPNPGPFLSLFPL